MYSYHNGPDRTVFMDGRLEVCTRRTFDLYERILDAMAAGDRSWEKLLKDFYQHFKYQAIMTEDVVRRLTRNDAEVHDRPRANR